MKKQSIKFYITTLGCKANQYDSLALKRRLTSAGFEHDKEAPDLVIVNTCAVTKTAIKKDRRTLNALKNKHPQAKFIFMGCFPETYQVKADEFGADLVWGTGELDELTKEIRKLTDISTDVITSVSTSIDPPKSGERSRYFLKIQDGCEQFCAYCNIPYSRGKLRSVSTEEVLDEIAQAVAVGFREVVLCGIHLGLYGKEKNSKTCDLVTLLKDIIKIPKLDRIRLGSIEANDISDELLQLIAESDKIAPHLHIPLQSGSDKILKKMNRPYDTKFFANVVGRARKLLPKIAITTDVMVGFPGEGDEEFLETIKFCKKMRFSKTHVFPFSAHEKTPAAKMESQVADQLKKERAEQLRKVSEKTQKEFREAFRGKEVKMVVEKIEKGLVKGKTEYYFDVAIPLEKITTKKPLSREDIGEIVKVTPKFFSE